MAQSPDATPPVPEKPEAEPTHTGQGAPTDQAHEDVGDGTLTGSTPAGLTSDELAAQARGDKTVDGGTG